MSAFDPRDLLGKAEGDRLEFKEAEALRRPANIAREVVGFLNAQGGDIWIGVKEGGGKAVELQTIPNIETARRSLLDSLIDLIEPQFNQEEVGVSCEGTLIRVSVSRSGQNPPYAVRDGGRRFLVRIDDRLREMSREELASAFSAGSTKKESSMQASAQTKDELRKAQRSEALAKDQLWLRIVPTESLQIDFNDEPTRLLQ
jgi:predicted HTH transcriptional regulator